MKPIKSFFLNDKIIFGLILINSIIIFVQGFPSNTLGDTAYRILGNLDDAISLLFVCEVVIKSIHFGVREYLKSTWNKFDVLLILLSLPPLLVRVLPIEFAATHLSFLLVFRVFRIFKFFRFIQFFPQVEQIFGSIQEAMKASFMVLIGFVVFIFITSILSCYFYQTIAPHHFGDPIVSFYTMFKIFTIEGWNAIPDELAASGQLGTMGCFFTKLYFVSILILGGIIGLSIVNSIFVDAMISNNTENVEMEEQVNVIEKKVLEMESKLDQILLLLKKEDDNSSTK